MGAFDRPAVPPGLGPEYGHIERTRREVMREDYQEPEHPSGFQRFARGLGGYLTRGQVAPARSGNFRHLDKSMLTPEQLERLQAMAPIDRVRFFQNNPAALEEIMSLDKEKFDHILLGADVRAGLPPSPSVEQVSPGTSLVAVTPGARGETPTAESIYTAGTEPSENITRLQNKKTNQTQDYLADDPAIPLMLKEGWEKVAIPTKEEVTTRDVTDLTPATTSALQKDLDEHIDMLARVTNLQNEMAQMDRDKEGRIDEFLTVKGQAKNYLYTKALRMGLIDADSPEGEFTADYAEFERLVYNDMNRTINALSGAAVSPAEMDRLKLEMQDLKRLSGPAFRRRVSEMQKSLKLVAARKIFFLRRGLTIKPYETMELADTEAKIRRVHADFYTRNMNQGVTEEDAFELATRDTKDLFGISVEDIR